MTANRSHRHRLDCEPQFLDNRQQQSSGEHRDTLLHLLNFKGSDQILRRDSY
jgi:hypothetical protein